MSPQLSPCLCPLCILPPPSPSSSTPQALPVSSTSGADAHTSEPTFTSRHLSLPCHPPPFPPSLPHHCPLPLPPPPSGPACEQHLLSACRTSDDPRALPFYGFAHPKSCECWRQLYALAWNRERRTFYLESPKSLSGDIR